MYNYGAVLPSTAGGALALTGTGSVWVALASFAILAAGTAVWRMVPRREA